MAVLLAGAVFGGSFSFRSWLSAVVAKTFFGNSGSGAGFGAGTGAAAVGAFEPVASIFRTTFLVAVGTDSKLKTMTDLIAGRVSAMFDAASVVVPFIKSGQLRPLLEGEDNPTLKLAANNG